MGLKINKRTAKSISWSGSRKLKAVQYIVIHYTGNKGDTAKNNVDYFATGNTRPAGAHFFVDKKGEIWQSVAMTKNANAVGGNHKSGAKGEAKYYGVCKNSNSVSIELCDCVNGTNWEQMLATRQLVQYIQKKCPNANVVIRHWDVNGKNCPAPMVGANNEKWELFHRFITKGYRFEAKVTKKAAIRSSAKVMVKNKTGTANIGDKIEITALSGNWGRLRGKDAKGRNQWISLSKVKEI